MSSTNNQEMHQAWLQLMKDVSWLPAAAAGAWPSVVFGSIAAGYIVKPAAVLAAFYYVQGDYGLVPAYLAGSAVAYVMVKSELDSLV